MAAAIPRIQKLRNEEPNQAHPHIIPIGISAICIISLLAVRVRGWAFVQPTTQVESSGPFS